jgi:mannose-6-phosphate isomerase
MAEPLYPLRFKAIFKTALWGGHALRSMLGATPSPELTGEAWLLSDHGDNYSCVSEGPLAGTTLRKLMIDRQRELIGDAPTANGRFPLLLKLLEAKQHLSVQVHPDDERARHMESADRGLGKTEAWVILNTEGEGRIYAGLRPGFGRDDVKRAAASGTLAELLHSFSPRASECIYLHAGTVHAIGAGVTLFEVQQTSDITYRLDDWGRVDARTGRPRELHLEKALACIDFERGPCGTVTPVPLPKNRGERLVACSYFTVDRLRNERPFDIGMQGQFRIVVCIEGRGSLLHEDNEYPLVIGDTLLIPASVGVVECIPEASLTVLEIACPV